MDAYILWAIFGFILLFVEMMTPTLFFLNLATAAFFSAILAWIMPTNYIAQVLCFVVLSAIFLLFLRPLVLKKQEKALMTGIEAKYIGQEALVVKAIGMPNTSGIGDIKIYGEVWQAKSENGEEIPAETKVEIVDNESIIMIVRKKGE